MKLKSGFLLPILMILSFGPSAWATTDSDIHILEDERFATPSGPSILIDPEEKFRRAQAVLRHFSVPVEPESQDSLDHLQLKQSKSEVDSILPYLDLENQFSRFSELEESSEQPLVLNLKGFQDRDSKKTWDYTVQLNKLASVEKVRTTSTLEGVRIALDPGHMGGDEWDRLTGKYIVDQDGNKVSEGVIALQTALLLEEELTQLGAEVLITRRTLDPVTSETMQSFDLDHYGKVSLRQSVLQGWFQQILTQAPAGPELFSYFESSPQVKKLFSEKSRRKYFIRLVDLQARVKKNRRL